MEKELYNAELQKESVLKSFNELSDLSHIIGKDKIENIKSLEKERREMFKYIGTLAGAGATLAPQIFNVIDDVQKTYFFLGVSFLVTTVIIAMSYVTSSIENGNAELIKVFRKEEEKVKKLKDIEMAFLLSDGSFENFQHYASGVKLVNEELTESEKNRIEKGAKKENRFYKGLDYASEYLLWFFSCGIIFLILSITNTTLNSLTLMYYGVAIFIFIVLISIIQDRFFVILGFPVDIVRACFRWFSKKVCKSSN